MSLRRIFCVLGLSATFAAAGCGTAANTTSSPIVRAGINGIIHGGQQPVGYATLQLYTVGTSGDGSAAIPMLTRTVQSDSSGNFSITGDYSCANSNATQVYLTATGGQPTAFSTNANLALMVALGPCSALTPNTYVTINELTTVAAVSALQPYMTGIAAIGSGSSDAPALVSAMTLAGEYVSPSAGGSPGVGVPTGYTVPSTEINTLGDVIAACINSAGGHAGDGTPCGNLFTLTTVNNIAPTDTITALLNIASNPTQNTTALFDTVPTISPFQPTLGAPPANFTIALQATTALMVSPASLPFGSVTQGYPSPAQIISLRNTGATTVSLSSIAVGGANAGDFTATSGCGPTLAAGSSCSVSVVATPGAIGARTGTLAILSNAPQSPQSITFSVTGVAPSAGPVTLSPSSLSWNVAGTIQDVVLTNQGSIPLSVGSVTVQDAAGGANFGVFNNGCGTSVAAGASCTISVISTAMSIPAGPSFSYDQAATFTGALIVSDNAASSSQTVTLTSANPSQLTAYVAGVSQIGVIALPDTTVGSSSTVGLMYQGATRQVLPTPLQFKFSGADAGDFTETQSQSSNGSTQACQFDNYPYNAACNITITFTPQAAGTRAANAYVANSQYVVVTGSTTIESGLTASPSFANLTSYLPATPNPNSLTHATEAVRITNTGSTAYNLTYTFSGPNAAIMYVNSNGCTTLAAGANCAIALGFTPTASLGSYIATLTIADASSGASRSIPVRATTSDWSLVPQPASLSFIAAPNTTSASQSITMADPNGYPTGSSATIALQSNSHFVLPNGGSCPGSITQTCSVPIEFAPATTGTVTETATATDLTTGLVSTINLSGAGGVLQLSLSPSPVVFTAQTVNTTPAVMQVTVTNTGVGVVQIGSIALSGAVNNNFTQTNNCAQLSMGNSCTINVTFAPTATGAQSASIAIVSNAANSPNALSIMGTSLPVGTPAAALTPSSLSWNIEGALQDVTLANTGTAALTIGSIAEADTAGNANFSVYSTTCGSTLAAQASCIITMRSNVSQISGFNVTTYTGTLTVTDNAAAGTQTVSLRSADTGSIGSAVTLSATDVGASSTAVTQYTLLNNGIFPPSIAYPTLGGADPGDFSVAESDYQTGASPCGGYPGDPCLVSVTFTPAATGARTAQLYLQASYPAYAGEYILLTGTATPPGPGFTVQSSVAITTYVPSSPDPGAGSVYTLPIKNTGTTPFTFSATFSGPNASMMSASAGTCTNAAKGTTCNAQVTFTPNGTVGTYTATMVVKDANSSVTQTVQITGTTTYWAVKVSPASLTFPQQALGTQSVSQYLTISDVNGYPLAHPVSVTLQTSSNFTLPQGSTCAASATQTCSIAVAFNPNRLNGIYEYATVTDTVSGNTASVPLNGTGGTAQVSLQSTSVTFPTTGESGSSFISDLLTNTGVLPLTISSITVTSASDSPFGVNGSCGSSSYSQGTITLQPAATCSLTLGFDPQTVNTFSATVTIYSNATNSPSTIALYGTSSSLRIVNSSVSFGSVTQGSPSTIEAVSLINSGSATVTLNSVAITGANASDFTITSSNCGTTLAASASCYINMSATPSAVGARSAALVVTSTAPGSPEDVPLTVTGTP